MNLSSSQQNNADDDLRAISKRLNEIVKVEAAKYAKDLETLVDKELSELCVDYKEVPRSLLEEAAFNCAKDIYKIALYHPDGVEPLKAFGYMCFWVRKIKPIVNPTKNGNPFDQINELISIHLGAALCLRYARQHPDDVPNGDADAVKRRAQVLLNDNRRMDYLIHSMRYRTFGPHHYVMILQNIVYGFD